MSATWKGTLYVLACLVVPMLWGVFIVRVSNAVERWLRARHDREIPPIEFYI